MFSSPQTSRSHDGTQWETAAEPKKGSSVHGEELPYNSGPTPSSLLPVGGIVTDRFQRKELGMLSSFLASLLSFGIP